MTLFRVSDFCRSTQTSAKKTEVVLHVENEAPPRHRKCCSVGWVTADVLVALSIQEGALAWLSFGLTTTAGVKLRIFLKEEPFVDDVVDDEAEEDELPDLRIFVPPIVAANLGIFDSLGAICVIQLSEEIPEPASHVILRPLGRPAEWPRLGNSDSSAEYWIFPGSGTLIQHLHLVSVYDPSSGRICYYHVLVVEPIEGSNQSTPSVFTTSDATTFHLDSTKLEGDFVVPRLPCLISQRSFYQSNPNKDFMVPPHPNLSELVRAFEIAPEGRPEERILHVVGTNADHDLCVAVETAAQRAGRNCWSLRGLAAFAHSVGHNVRTGSLVDQLAGLQAALDEIQQMRMEPCVLHLYDLDAELSINDDPLRHEQEERIWGKLIQSLASRPTGLLAGSRGPHDPSSNGQLDRRYTCPLIVVLSTTSPLKSGAWMEKLVFPSISLSTPNAEYTRFLWKGALSNDPTMDLLRGRSNHEIRRIHHEVADIKDAEEAYRLIQKLCEEDDSRRRKTRSASVSQVRWEDVGGLAHVRDEIMDAIELPLKHPHLFPKGRGRSGILLYGPPGTGKTLVAKAVATECGLPFLSIKGPELLGSYVGESEANIRGVFQSARDAAEQNAPLSASILFFDELDSLAPKRGGVGDGGGVMERVVATLFAELDGDTTSSPARVFVMGATNRPDLLDPSLLRPGRLDRSVYLGIATDPAERARILAAQLHKLKLEGDPLEVSKAVVARLPERLTGADFSTIASGALLQAVERLCRAADEEHEAASQAVQHQVELHDILETWDVEKCTPTILLDDLLEAAKHVTPSVTKDELDRYERLREQYSVNVVGPIEHDGDVFY